MPDDRPPTIEALVAEAEELCAEDDREHITEVIGDLDLPMDEIDDQYEQQPAGGFDHEAMARVLLYKHACDFKETVTSRRIQSWPYISLRFGLDSPPSPQVINYIKKNRFSDADRHLLEVVGKAIGNVADEHDIKGASNPESDSETAPDGGITIDELKQATQVSLNHGFRFFDTGRAENRIYDDDVFFQLQAYLSREDTGTTDVNRVFNLASDREETPHGDTHLRTMKMLASPDEQVSLDDFGHPEKLEDWRRIRDCLLEPFHESVDLPARSDYAGKDAQRARQRRHRRHAPPVHGLAVEDPRGDHHR